MNIGKTIFDSSGLSGRGVGQLLKKLTLITQKPLENFLQYTKFSEIKSLTIFAKTSVKTPHSISGSQDPIRKTQKQFSRGVL